MQMPNLVMQARMAIVQRRLTLFPELDLAQLAANVNSGISYENKYFKQTVNIHLNNHDWMPIGTTTNPLRANYDGEDMK